MHKFLTRLLAAFALVALLPAAPAMAQATRTWVSGVGDDVNPCSRTAPCKTFAGAISKTAAGGEINALDPGGFGTVTITKSITISAVGAEGGVLASGTNGIIISAAATDRVVLRGLDIDGSGSGLNGVRVLQAADVLIEDTVIHNFSTAGSAGVKVETSAPTRVTISRSTIHSNDIGINVVSTGGTGHVRLVDSLVLDSRSQGLVVDGAGNDIFILNNRIIGRNSLNATNGGDIRSYGNNLITGGAATPTSTAPLQ